ncbi:MAG: hypothetical protein B6I32_08195 [Desulfobacterium sp. 4572_20]|nr:MAG: hypothetical protein B6I32_08195 [Desulfobacterium sp. 4572_20]
MFKTKMTEMLGVKYPIVGGTMMHISNAEFTAAISNAGGLGILASAIYQSREAFSEALDQLIELTDKPFAVNLNLFPAMHPIDNNDYLDVLLEKGAKIVETSGHSAPQELCARFKEAVIMGTRLLTTKEAPIHDRLKEALVKAGELDTMLVMRSIGATHRVWINAAAKKVAELEADQAGLPEILKIATGEKAKKMYNEGDLDVGIISCGQGIGMAHDIPTVKELFDRIMGEGADVAKGLVAD